MARIEGKKILMIIASRDFRDEELLKPYQILSDNGASVTVASSTVGELKGMLGATIEVETLLEDVEVKDYDAVIFVGGTGAAQYWDNPLAHNIAQETVKFGKVLAAICIAPVTLANAGLLKGKKATVFNLEIEKLKAKGAIYTGRDVEVDGKMITANGPASAEKFGEAILKALQSPVK